MNLRAIGLIYSSINGVFRMLPSGEIQALRGKLESRAPRSRSLIPSQGEYPSPQEALKIAQETEQRIRQATKVRPYTGRGG